MFNTLVNVRSINTGAQEWREKRPLHGLSRFEHLCRLTMKDTKLSAEGSLKPELAFNIRVEFWNQISILQWAHAVKRDLRHTIDSILT